MAISSVLGSSALLPAGLGFRNTIINGGMDVWQRGSSGVAISNGVIATAFLADRWCSYRPASGSTQSRVTAGLDGFQYALRMQRDSGNTSVAALYMNQSIETNTMLKLANKQVTLSFYARAGANYSASGSLFGARVVAGTGTDINIIYTGVTGGSEPVSTTPVLTTSWQRFTATGLIPSGTTAGGVYFFFTPTGTAGTNDYVDITGVQLEQNLQPTPFEQRPYGVELALCQRYYFRKKASTTAPYAVFGHAQFGGTSTTARAFVPAPVPMRTLINAIDYGGTLNMNQHYVANYTATSITSNVNTGTHETQLEIGMTLSGAGPAAGTFGAFGAGNDANAYIGFSAEL